MNPVKSRLEIAEAVLKELNDAAHSVLCESNGVSDNEWKVEGGGVAVPEWPVESFYAAIRKLDSAYTKAKDYFNPKDGEKRQKWENACATASYIMDRLKEDRKAGTEHPNIIDSHLHRNIADAINGSLIQTASERAAGIEPETATDQLNKLVAEGKLFKL